MNIKRILSTLAAAFIALPSFACDVDGITGIMPENDMEVSAFDVNANKMTEQEFNGIINRVISVYGPIVEQKGGVLTVNRLWKTNKVNASAMRKGNEWVINMFGGLARHKKTSPDAFMLVVCHELGHQIGGTPMSSLISPLNPYPWATNEGQSDYWAATKCMPRVLAADDNARIMSVVRVPAMVKQACDSVHKDDNSRALCARIAMAGKSLAELFGGGFLSFLGKPANFHTPDKKVVNSTFSQHPRSQCRLDTYFAGAQCVNDFTSEPSYTDAKVGFCTKSDGSTVGMRPLCWYKPAIGE